MVEQTGAPQLTTEELWGHLFGQQEGHLVTFVGRQSDRLDARPNELDDPEQRSWRYPRDQEKAAEYLRRRSESGCDVYFGVHLFKKPGNRRKDNAAEKVWALWCDTDGAMLPESYPTPNIRVESSPGREHLYWLFSRALSAKDAAQLNRRIAYGMQADIGKWGLGTVLRAPGTLNYKRQESTMVSARLVSSEPYDPDYLDGALPAAEEGLPGTARRHRSEKRGGSPRHESASFGEPPVALTPADLEAWNGVRTVAGDDGGVDRSRTLHWIACGVARGLRRAGISEAQSHRIVADAVEERDFGLGYRKYTDREDRVERYAELAKEGLAEADRDAHAALNGNAVASLPGGGSGNNGDGAGGGSKKSKGKGGSGDKQPPPADRLLGYVWGEDHELFVDQFGAPHIWWRREPIALSATFDRHLRTLMVGKEGRSAGGDVVKQARDTLAAFAYASGDEWELHTRAAWHEDALYYQLGPKRILKVDSSGYGLVEEAPVLFRTVRNLSPLPDPKEGGDFDVLSNWINLKNTRDKRLYIAWLVTALLPHVARPILEATGEMGAGKTVLGRTAKRLLDPSRPETVQLDRREFLQKAAHAYIVMLDNLNSLPEWAVDTLCRLVTGEADSKRVLYEVDEDFIYEMQRAILINGINIPTDRGDARDRTLPIELERIKNHRPEEEMWREFADAHPQLLGCVFDTLSKALALKPSVRLTRHARLADWSVYAASVYEALGWGAAKFEEDWKRVVRVQNHGTLEGSGLAQAIVAFMEERRFWRGTSSELYEKLKTFAEGMSIDTHRDPRWPNGASWVWRRIREVRPLLTAMGIDTQRDTSDARGTIIALTHIGKGDDPGNLPPEGGESTESGSASICASKNPMLAQMLAQGYPADTAESASSASSASISGYSSDKLSRLKEEEGTDTVENGGLEGKTEPENTVSPKGSENAFIASIASMEWSFGGSEGVTPLLYVDPPYVRSTRSRDYYPHEMGEEDHERLLSALVEHPGAVVLSGYDNALYREALAGWHRSETPGRAQRNAAGRSRTEVLWSNDAAWRGCRASRDTPLFGPGGTG